MIDFIQHIVRFLNDNNRTVTVNLYFQDITSKKIPEYTFFSSAHGTFSRTDKKLGHKTSLNKFKSIEIIFSNHNDMKLEINHRKGNE